MDFINLWPYDVVDLIFQHLCGKDIINYFLVSRFWRDHLTRSSSLKRIVIFPKSEDPNLKYLLNSQRKYRHLRVVNGTLISKEVVEIAANPFHKFDSIIIIRTEFSKKQMEQILLSTSNTVKRLELQYNYLDIEKESDELSSTSYDFPKLKTFKLEYAGTLPWINQFVRNLPSIQSLTLTNACDERMKKIILKSTKLRNLTLSGKFYDKNFYKHLSLDMTARLEVFIFNDILSSSQEDENLSYFNAFFTSQSKTLKRFETDALLEPEEIQSSFQMPNLFTLNIKGFHIQNIEMMNIYLENLRTSPSVPASSLKCFSVNFLNQHLLELLALNARNLKELRAVQFDPSDVSNKSWFTKLEVLKIYSIDNELKNILNQKTESDCSHFEKMILAAIANINKLTQPNMFLQVQRL